MRGADVAWSISQVAGQLLGRRILGEEYVALEPRMRVAKARVGSLEGLAVRNARIREHPGCPPVAVVRADGLLPELDGDLTLRSGDIVYLVGSNEAVGRYFSRYPNARTETGSGTSVEE
jgi:Trk K+ transport system NAD-binding subunit